MAINYTLDEQDLSTHQFVNQITHGADKIDAQLLQTQSTYSIDHARVVALGNPRYAGMPVNPLAVRLDLSLVGFENAPGQYSKLVNDKAQTLEDQYQKGSVDSRSGNVAMMYRVNDDELKALIDGGLYADPRQFNRNLDLISSGKQFSIPDQVRVSTMQFQDNHTHGISLGSLSQSPTYTISSAQPVSNLTAFDHNTADNSYTFLFSNLTAALSQRRFHPEGEPNIIIKQAEERQQQHQSVIEAQKGNQTDHDIQPALQEQGADQKKSRVRLIAPDDDAYQLNNQTLDDDELQPKFPTNKQASSSSGKLNSEDEQHLQDVLNEITNKAARDNRNATNNDNNTDKQNQQQTNQNSQEHELDGK